MASIGLVSRIYLVGLGGQPTKVIRLMYDNKIYPGDREPSEISKLMTNSETQIIDMAHGEEEQRTLIKKYGFSEADQITLVGFDSQENYKMDNIVRAATLHGYKNIEKYRQFIEPFIRELGPGQGVKRTRQLARYFVGENIVTIQNNIRNDYEEDFEGQNPDIAVLLANLGGGFGSGSFLHILPLITSRTKVAFLHLPVGSKYRLPARDTVYGERGSKASMGMALIELMYVNSISRQSGSNGYVDEYTKYISETLLRMTQKGYTLTPPDLMFLSGLAHIEDLDPFISNIEETFDEHDNLQAETLMAALAGMRVEENRIIHVVEDNNEVGQYYANISGTHLAGILTITDHMTISSIKLNKHNVKKYLDSLKTLIDKENQMLEDKKSLEEKLEKEKKELDYNLSKREVITQALQLVNSTKLDRISDEKLDKFMTETREMKAMLDQINIRINAIGRNVANNKYRDAFSESRKLYGILNNIIISKIPEISGAVENVMSKIDVYREQDVANIVNETIREGKVAEDLDKFVKNKLLINNVKDELQELQRIVRTRTESISTLLGELEKRIHVADRITRSNKLRTKVQLEKSNEKLNEISNEINLLINKLNTIEGKINNINNAIVKELKRRLEEQNSIIERINNQIEEYEEQIRTIEQELTGIRRELYEKTSSFISEYLNMLVRLRIISRGQYDAVSLAHAITEKQVFEWFVKQIESRGELLLSVQGAIEFLGDFIEMVRERGVELPTINLSAQDLSHNLRQNLTSTLRFDRPSVEISLKVANKQDILRDLVFKEAYYIVATADNKDLVEEIRSHISNNVKGVYYVNSDTVSFVGLLKHWKNIPLVAIKEIREVLKEALTKVKIDDEGREEYLGLRFSTLDTEDERLLEFMDSLSEYLEKYEEQIQNPR